MPIDTYLTHCAVHLPSTTVTSQDLGLAHPDWDMKKVSQKTGIHSLRVCGKDETAVDLASQAVSKLFDMLPLLKDKVDFLIFCTQSPDYFLPTSACLIQHRTGIPTSAGAIDVNLGCSGYVYSLGIAKGLIASGQCRNVLVVTGDTYSKYISPDDRNVRVLFGDAASASLVSHTSSCGWRLGDFTYGTDGGGANNLIVEGGASRSPGISARLTMNGPAIFEFTATTIPGAINSLLIKSNFSISDIDLFIFHQANKFMLDHLRKHLEIPESKFLTEFSDIGNTVSSSIPIVLSSLLSKHDVKPGTRMMFVGFGVGYSWSACLLTAI